MNNTTTTTTNEQLDGGVDKLSFDSSVTPDHIRIARDGAHLIIALDDLSNPGQTIADLADQVRIENWFTAEARIELLEFADGSILDIRDLAAFDAVMDADGAQTGSGDADWIEGTVGDDTVLGSAGADVIVGGSGVDNVDFSAATAGVTVNLSHGTGSGDLAEGDQYLGIEAVVGSDFDDTLTGDEGSNVLSGGDGADTLTGSGGIDTLEGGGGSDTYVFGDSWNTLIDNADDAAVRAKDIVEFSDDVAAEDLWFEQVGDNLLVREAGTTNTLVMTDWFDPVQSAAQRHVSFQTADCTLFDSHGHSYRRNRPSSRTTQALIQRQISLAMAPTQTRHNWPLLSRPAGLRACTGVPFRLSTSQHGGPDE